MARKKTERAYADDRKSKFVAGENQQPSTSTGLQKSNRKIQRDNNVDGYFDKNDKHFISFNNQLLVMGLTIRNVNGDGNCLFRALNDQMEGHSRNHIGYRLEVVRYMKENRHDFEPFVEDDVPFDKYMDNLSKNGTYGGQDVLVAFARMRKVNIVIHQLNSPLWNIDGGSSKNAYEVHLSYHNGEHYSSIRKINDNAETPANVRLNLPATPVQQNKNNNKTKKSSEYVAEKWQNYDDFVVDEFDDLEAKIQSIMHETGCTDRTLVQQTLMDCNYDVDETVDRVVSLMVISLSEDQPPNPETLFPPPEEIKVEEPKLQLENNFEIAAEKVQSGAKPKRPLQFQIKHVSNKERKDSRRRERLQRQKNKVKPETTTTDNKCPPANDDDVIVATNIGCLNL